jgi:predicted Zn-dependent protease
VKWIVLIALAGTARADLLDEVQKTLQPLRAQKSGDDVKRSKAAAVEAAKAQKELEKAEERVKAAQAQLAASTADKAKQEKAATAAHEHANKRKDSSRAVLEAAHALEKASAMVKKGNGNVDAELDEARKDRSLAEAAQAVGAMAAYLKGDSKRVLAMLTPEVQTAFPSARRYVGMAKLQLGDKDGAYRAFKDGKLPSSDVEGQVMLGKMAMEHKDWETAREAYANAFSADSTSADAAIGLARALFAAGRAADAVGPLTVAAADPTNKEANYLLGVVSERAGERRRAELAFGNVVAEAARGAGSDPSYLRPGRPLRVIPLSAPWTTPPDTLDEGAARVRLAWYALERGDWEGAVALLAKATRSDALYLRGLAELRGQMMDAAHADLRRATELEPKRVETRCALGVVQLDEGDAPTAQETFEFNGDDPPSQIGEAMALGELGKRDQAIAKLTKLSAQKGVTGDAVATDLAALKRAAGDGNGAWKALPDKPLSAVGWMLKALLLVDRKTPKLALPATQSAIERAPSYVDAWVLQAKLDEQLGDDKGALKAASRALELNGALVEAMAIRARLFHRAGDKTREAVELARLRDLGDRATAAAAAKPTGVVAAVATVAPVVTKSVAGAPVEDSLDAPPRPAEPVKPAPQPEPTPRARQLNDSPLVAPSLVEKPTPVYKKWWLWTTLGLVVAGGVVGGVLGVMLQPSHSIPAHDVTIMAR